MSMFPKETIDSFKKSDHPGIKQRIIWHSVAPHIRSGYGTITRHICTRLHEIGYNVIVSAYYGIEPGGVVVINDVPIIPCARHLGSFGEGSYINHYKAFSRTVGILASDFWAFPWFPAADRYSIMYSPMDHVDYGLNATNVIQRYNKVVAFLPFQAQELGKHGLKNPPIIEHGVDKSFKPMDKIEARKMAQLPKDDFIIGIVSANSDKEMRKSWGAIFTAAEIVRKEHPEIRNLKYFVHSDPEDPKGVSLRGLAHNHGVLDLFAFEDTALSVVGIPDNEMNLIYNSFDLLLCPSKREGFGLPILESMACGKPAIVHNFSSMPDLVGHNAERGWLCESQAFEDTPIIATTAIVNPRSIADQIVDAYMHPDEVIRKGKLARTFSQTMLWDDIVLNKWVKILDEAEDEQTTRKNMPDIAKIEV